APLEPREAEVHVVDVNRSIDIVVTYADHAVQRASLFLEAPRQVDVRGLDQRIAAEDRVAVLAAAAHVDVRIPTAIAHADEVTEQLGLEMAFGARDAGVHFLEEQNVGVEVAEDFSGAL